MIKPLCFFYVFFLTGLLSNLGLAQEGRIEVEARVIEISEESYAKNQKKADAIMQSGDYQKLSKLFGNSPDCDWVTTPSVVIGTSRSATLEIVREVRYPRSFERSENGGVKPHDFEAQRVGVSVLIMGTIFKSDVLLEGWFVIRDIEGYAFKNPNEAQPAFVTLESRFHSLIQEGKTVGFWLPGVRTLTESSARLGKIADLDPSLIGVPNSKTRPERRKVGFFLTLRSVTK